MKERLKKWLSYGTFGNILTVALLVAFAFVQGPSILANYRSEGMAIGPQQYDAFFSDGKNKNVLFPPPKSQAIAIFWASWCGPCKVEMKRLKASVEEGKIPIGKIFAVNPYETAAVARKFAAQNNFPFVFIQGKDIGKKLDIRSTPTTLFIKNATISSRSSGMSLVGIWKAEFFF